MAINQMKIKTFYVLESRFLACEPWRIYSIEELTWPASDIVAHDLRGFTRRKDAVAAIKDLKKWRFPVGSSEFRIVRYERSERDS